MHGTNIKKNIIGVLNPADTLAVPCPLYLCIHKMWVVDRSQHN